MLERYEKLGLRESLSRAYDYPSGCRELGFLLRETFKKVPKNLQAIMFQDTLAAFTLLPEYASMSHVIIFFLWNLLSLNFIFLKCIRVCLLN